MRFLAYASYAVAPWIDQLESLEVGAIDAPVARQQAVRMHVRVRSDDEVGDDALATPSAPAVAAEAVAGGERRRRIEGREDDAEGVELSARVRSRGEADRDLRPHDLARNQGPFGEALREGVARPRTVLGVGREDIDQDAGVDRGDQIASGLPRSRSSSSSVDSNGESTP